MQFNLNECIVGSHVGEMNSMELHNGSLYKLNFTKVHGEDVVDLVQSWKKNGAFKVKHHGLGHLNVKHVHVFLNMMSDLNFHEEPCHTILSICDKCL